MSAGIREYKKAFFDVSKVSEAVAKGAKKILSRYGAFVRQRARSSIRPSKKSALPGAPPKSHEGSLRRLILFAYDARKLSIVIGPVPFAGGLAPGLLERGGPATRKLKRGTRQLQYRGNPFMAPAAQAEMPKFLEMLKNAIK